MATYIAYFKVLTQETGSVVFEADNVDEAWKTAGDLALEGENYEVETFSGARRMFD